MKFRNLYILFLLLVALSCKKEESAPQYIVQVWLNESLLKPYWSSNNSRQSWEQTPIPDTTTNVVLKLEDDRNVVDIDWNINGVSYTGKTVNLGRLDVGKYTVSAVVKYRTNKFSKVKKTTPIMISKDWPYSWGYTFSVFKVLYIEDYPFYAAPSYVYGDYYTTSHITTTTVQTHTTIVNYGYSITGADMARMTHYRYLAITLPENESIEVKQYHFTSTPKSQSGVWFGVGESSGVGSGIMQIHIDDILRLGWTLRFTEVLSADNFFNVTAIITEDGVKKIVGDYKYNDDIKGKFKLRIE